MKRLILTIAALCTFAVTELSACKTNHIKRSKITHAKSAEDTEA